VSAFIEAHRADFGVEPICKVLQVASSAYRLRRRRVIRPDLRSKRARSDEQALIQIRRVWDESGQLYGARKVWEQLKRDLVEIPRCRVERLMRTYGLAGVRRDKGIKTTVSDPKVPCPTDLVKRQFHADRPNQLWVSDFTYVSTWAGFVYVAFVVDVYARYIVGWKVSYSMSADFVLDALEQAIHARRPKREDGLIHHSDHGVQYLSIRYSGRLIDAGLKASTGTVGDSYDNAMAETINGLYKTEVIRRKSSWRNLEEVEWATLVWVEWFNNRRLLSSIGYLPPAEAEANYYATIESTISV
jgi:transposase InsO family protein